MGGERRKQLQENWLDIPWDYNLSVWETSFVLTKLGEDPVAACRYMLQLAALDGPLKNGFLKAAKRFVTYMPEASDRIKWKMKIAERESDE